MAQAAKPSSEEKVEQKQSQPVASTKQKPAPQKTKVPEGKQASSQDKKEEKEKKTKGGKKERLWVKEIFLAIVNIGFIVSLVVFLGRLSDRAVEFKRLRGEEIDTTAKSSFEVAQLELESNKEKVDKLSAFFPDETGLLDFVNAIDGLKEEGVVSTFAFTSEKAVRDKTGFFGIPVFIEFTGDWGQISRGLESVQELPFLLRTISVQTERDQGSGLVIFKYGGFLYVDESLAEN